jgi:hypothetical protein
MHEGLPWGDSPVDFEDDDQPGIGWAALAIYGASAMLLFLNAHAILNWANQLELTDTTAPIVVTAENWYAQTGQFGLNQIVDSVKAVAQEARAADWPFSDAKAPTQAAQGG